MPRNARVEPQREGRVPANRGRRSVGRLRRNPDDQLQSAIERGLSQLVEETSALAATQVEPKRIASAGGEFANVLLGMTFPIDQAQIHLMGDARVSDVSAIRQRLDLVDAPLKKARSEIADAMQVNASSLPIVWSQLKGDEIFVGILVPDGSEPRTLFGPNKEHIEQIANHWKQVLNSLDSRSVGGSTEVGGEPKEMPTKLDRIEPSAKKLEQSLRTGTTSFGVAVSLVCNGERVPGSIATIRVQPEAKPTSGYPSNTQEQVFAAILSLYRGGKCDLRLNNSKRLHKAVFSTENLVARQLTLLVGGPSVTLGVKRVTSGQTGKPAFDFLIEEVVALSRDWRDGRPSPLESLATDIERLRQLPSVDPPVESKASSARGADAPIGGAPGGPR